MKIKNLALIIIISSIFINNSYAIEPDVFVKSTLNRATKVLSDDITKDQKIDELKKIAIDTVDIERIGFYTLGPVRKTLTEEQKKNYSLLFKEYFLTSFSNRLVEYSDPEIEIYDKKILSEKFAIVNSLLKGNNERPEVKIDWRIYTKDPENPKILDLIIEGLSLARTQKEEFSSILNSNDGNIDALFKVLEEFSKEN